MTNHSTDIVGYTYKAENIRADQIIERLIADGLAAPAARDMQVEDALDQIALANAIDRYEEISFDSDEFPKVIFRDQWVDEDEGEDPADHWDDDQDDEEMDALHEVLVLGFFREPGMMDTIVQFVGIDEGLNLYAVAVDHRPARDIVEVLCDEGEVVVRCEGWALSRIPDTAEILSLV